MKYTYMSVHKNNKYKTRFLPVNVVKYKIIDIDEFQTKAGDGNGTLCYLC
jgi:hypothetical protein